MDLVGKPTLDGHGADPVIAKLMAESMLSRKAETRTLPDLSGAYTGKPTRGEAWWPAMSLSLEQREGRLNGEMRGGEAGGITGFGLRKPCTVNGQIGIDGSINVTCTSTSDFGAGANAQTYRIASDVNNGHSRLLFSVAAYLIQTRKSGNLNLNSSAPVIGQFR